MTSSANAHLRTVLLDANVLAGPRQCEEVVRCGAPSTNGATNTRISASATTARPPMEHRHDAIVDDHLRRTPHTRAQLFAVGSCLFVDGTRSHTRAQPFAVGSCNHSWTARRPHMRTQPFAEGSCLFVDGPPIPRVNRVATAYRRIIRGLSAVYRLCDLCPRNRTQNNTLRPSAWTASSSSATR
jgi:hypothetical protein